MRLALWIQPTSVRNSTILRAFVVLAAGIVLALPVSERAVAASQGNAITAARFSISVDGVEFTSFSELVSISTSAQQAPATGGLPAGSLVKAAGITLQRGMNRGVEMWTWHEAATMGRSVDARKNVLVTAYDAMEKPVARFYLENAWPSKIEIGSLKAGSSEALMETVTLTCDFILRSAI